MEKNVQISMLCQIYKSLLTEKQFQYIDDYYNNDLSLSEIAENDNITRQAVRDVIKKGEKKLFEYEEKLMFLKKMIDRDKKISDIIKHIKKLKNEENSKILDEIEDKLNSLIELEQ